MTTDSTRPTDYDAELRLLNPVLRAACDIQRHERVLDVGCGTGQTTRDAARVALSGSALGVDTSAVMIARARELAQAEGLQNAAFEQGDAQVHRFRPEAFDVVISRFGTMFFNDPCAAFSNLRRALRSGGRLVMMVWQDYASNEWAVAIQRCLASGEGAHLVPAGQPDAFSLASQSSVKRILSDSGFAAATFTDVHEPVYYGQDVAAALDWVRGFSTVREMLRRLDSASAAGALERLRAMLAAHDTGQGVWLDSRAWIITATR